MDSVTLINAFEVPERHEAVFLARWQEAADYMRHQDGFVSTKLHASLNPDARFRFVNVAVWRSPEHFQRAVSSDEFADISRRMPFPHFPALYHTAVE